MNLKFIIILLAVIVTYLLKEFLLILFISFLLTTALLPLVQWFKQKKIPRILSSVLLVALLLVVPLGIAASLGSVVFREGQALVGSVPDLTRQLEGRLGFDIAGAVQERATNHSRQIINNVFQATGSVFSAALAFVVALVVTIYWLVYYDQARNGLIHFLAANKKQERFIAETYDVIEHRIGSWVKGQLLVSLAVGLLTWVTLLLIGVPYAGVLATVAAILEFIPTLGPIIAAIPALLIALTVNPQLFIVTLIAYIVIQQFESYVISPRLIGHATKMNPFAILLAILAGAHLLGIIGALIAVPATIIAYELYLIYRKSNARLELNN